jgi:hypothetical protein
LNAAVGRTNGSEVPGGLLYRLLANLLPGWLQCKQPVVVHKPVLAICRRHVLAELLPVRDPLKRLHQVLPDLLLLAGLLLRQALCRAAALMWALELHLKHQYVPRSITGALHGEVSLHALATVNTTRANTGQNA